ncbi:MAG: HD domain-containing protein [Nitrospiraceae bacterium]|nr:MAG: HD domain-containing protein [Nitrospiraceae bacterium]
MNINRLLFKLTFPLLVIIGLTFIIVVPVVIHINTSILEKKSLEHISHLSSMALTEIKHDADDLHSKLKIFVELPYLESALRARDTEQLTKLLLPAKISLGLDFLAAIDSGKNPIVFFSNQGISLDAVIKSDIVPKGLLGMHLNSLITLNNNLYSIAVVSSDTREKPKIIIAGKRLKTPLLRQHVSKDLHQARVLLYDAKGNIASEVPEDISGHENIAPETFNFLIINKKSVIKEMSHGDHAKHLVLYSPVIFENNVKALYAIHTTMTETITAKRKNLLTLSLILGTGMIMLIAAGYFTSRWITGRIGNLLEGTRKIAGGDLGYQVSDKSRDELGRLAASLNGMSTSLMLSHEWWSKTFNSMSDAVSIHDRNCTILKANYAMSSLLGIPADKLIGQKCHTVFHGTESCIDLCPMKLTMRTGVSEAIELMESHLNRWLSIAISPVHDQDGKTDKIVHVVRDITKNKFTENSLQIHLNRLKALRSIDKAIIGSIDLHVILETFLSEVLAQLNIDAACILLLNNKTQVLEYVTGKGFHSTALRYTRLRLGESNAGRAALERRIISIPNLREDIDGFIRSGFFTEEEFVTYFAVPLISKGQVKGVLEIFNRSFLDTDQSWLDFLEAIADQGAIAVDNATMFEDLQRSNLELFLAYDKTIEGWSRAMDMRDKETEGHSRRVTELTVYIAQEMGIKDEDLVHIRRGALLHDMGKMGIPDSILLKPGKLTDEEWKIMKLHPVYAYEMLNKIDYIKPALDIPYYHHEKWDGTGYPKGLKGEDIPIAARIFAVVDVWDALSSDRPYRPAWTREKTLNYIRSEAGTHFDSEVVRVFLKIMDSEEAETIQAGLFMKDNDA